MTRKLLGISVFALLASLLVGCGGDGNNTINIGGGGTEPEPADTTVVVPFSMDIDNCLVTGADTDFEIATWNIKFFPQTDSSFEAVKFLVEKMDLDILAIQEISGDNDFTALADSLEGWEYAYFNTSSQDVGYLYKTTEVEVLEDPVMLYEGDEFNYAFTAPRRPIMIKVRHSTGLEMNIINVHLKCCSGSEERRREASVLLEQYIDENLAEANVILLGDFNDRIDDEETDNVFENFILEPESYRFVTMDIANGDPANWSFENDSFVSHLDNILITNELYDNFVEAQTIDLKDCEPERYPAIVSDHLPVYMKLVQD